MCLIRGKPGHAPCAGSSVNLEDNGDLSTIFLGSGRLATQALCVCPADAMGLVRADDRLYEIANEALRNGHSPTLKASLPRILIAARGMSPNLMTWCRDEIESQTSTKGLSEIGFDIAAGAFTRADGFHECQVWNPPFVVSRIPGSRVMQLHESPCLRSFHGGCDEPGACESVGLRDISYGPVVSLADVSVLHLAVSGLPHEHDQVVIVQEKNDPMLIVRDTFDVAVVMRLNFSAKDD